MGLGPVDTVSLAGAREAAAEARKLVRESIDPVTKRRTDRIRAEGILTFRECAEAFIQAHEKGWKNSKHRQQWRNTLQTYVYPVFGDLPAGEVDTVHVLRVLEPIWHRKTETASRLRGRIERVLDWAKVRGYREGENPARWRGHMDALLPAKGRVQTVRHHPALPWQDMPQFMMDLRQRNGVAACALEFAILTAARSGEVRGARWEELDIEARTWIVPAERMKGRRTHRVPLSDAALAIISCMPRLMSSPYIFAGARGGELSDMALTAVLRRMGVEVTVHGFRSTFRDWAAEATAFPREVAEEALAHILANKVEAAYRRSDLFDKRRRLMEAWAAFCASPSNSAEIVPIRGAVADVG